MLVRVRPRGENGEMQMVVGGVVRASLEIIRPTQRMDQQDEPTA
jgi:hypothetical protein